MCSREGNAAAAEAGGKADASPQQADSLEAATSTEGREMSSVARTQSADGGRRSFDSLTSSRSSALPLLPQPYWSCPTSHSVQQEAAPKAAKGQGQDSSDGQPVKNLLPPSLPQLQKHERTEDRAEGSGAGAGGQAEGASAHPGSGRLSSLPIVLSRQNSNSSGEEEEEAASEPDAAGTLSSTSEEATSVEGSAQTTVEVSDSALHAAGSSLCLLHYWKYIEWACICQPLQLHSNELSEVTAACMAPCRACFCQAIERHIGLVSC